MRFAEVAIATLALFVDQVAAQSTAPSGKYAFEGHPRQKKGISRGKRKACCGYPLVSESNWALRFYWLAEESRFDDRGDTVDVYTKEGFFLGAFTDVFARSLLMEGTGVLNDGRVINYAGRCNYGTGTCYETMTDSHPYGRGAALGPWFPLSR